MIDLTIPLGRNVPTAAEVLSVIRPELRISRAIAEGVHAAMRAGWLEGTEDLETSNGADTAALEAVFNALKASALASVKDWAGDMDLVFDGAKVEKLIKDCLIDAEFGNTPDLPGGWDALDY